MSFSKILHELLCVDARMHTANEGEIHLKEGDPTATLRKVILDLYGEDCFSCVALDFKVKAGRSNHPSCLSELLNPHHSYPLLASCDALLCIEKDTVCHLIHIELKSGNDKAQAIKQLRNSRCFSKFLLELAAEWHDIKPNKCISWFVVFTGGRKAAVRKRKTSVNLNSVPALERPSNNPLSPSIISVTDGSRVHVGRLFRP